MEKEIIIIGLGSGDLEQLPLGVYKLMKHGGRLMLRTKEHPVVAELVQESIDFKSFDEVYEKHGQFEAVYEEITDTLLKMAEKERIIYAVPGHPMVAERTVQLLLEQGPLHEIDIKIGGGQSFLDSLFTAVKVDPVEGFQLLDGTLLHKEQIRIGQHVIIAQVYDAFVASDVKLTLMEKYPDDYEVMMVTAAGSKLERVTKIPLYELDRQMKLDNLTSLYVPPISSRELTYKEFSTLRDIIAELRGPNGCPWDKEQTHESLKQYLIEEAYELLDAIDRDDIDNMIEELGDVLLQILLHAQIGEDEGMFSIEDVIQAINEKMVRRHPHVFGDVQAEDSEQVVANWAKIKAEEKKDAAIRKSLLEGTSKGFPALLRSYEYQKSAAKVGFDWGAPEEAWEKVKEEMQEFEDELTNGNKHDQLMEFGDLLFALVNVARLLKFHPEEAMQTSNEKFFRRFSFIESKVHESGKPFEDYSLEELDQYWNEAKKAGL
ncbi:nucleoside triphosphate pyrophosphohydrolase [Lederbergia panacisoli]|uniref:nucleoside triphosphate pyrophosphohydrolase n=1 Tax=Lederbergia panacisoli TaxID=1255251 RepID=UPI00214C83D2|nr:nucleoside triphosphate pyrophosphohydrolase [Lederbergia panacisoli]MCR2823386.1 nucleoside triphosphate pyrophosphohydrolase [Lederbergia panacisoli]